MQNTGCPTH